MTVTANEAQSKNVRLSVIVVSLDCRSSLRECLESILPEAADDIEIIVIDRCHENAGWIEAEKYARVNFIYFPSETILPVLLSKGIECSTGEIIAVTDSSCIVADHWISSILKAHHASSPIIGGAVEMEEHRRSLTDWAAYFCDYGQFMLPARRGIVGAVPGNNISIKRWALETGTEFVKKEFWKTHWCRKMQSDGVQLLSEPSITVYWRKSYSLLPYLARRFHQGRCFAGMRISRESPRRLYYAAGSVLLPLIFMVRTILPVIRSQRFFGKLLLSGPIIFLSVCSWSIGEMAGFAAGTGTSCRKVD